MMLAYFVAVGLRAAFFIPSELRASWSFRVNAVDAAEAHLAGVRAAVIVLIGPASMLAAGSVGGYLYGPLPAILHAAVALLLVLTLAAGVAASVEHVPFTRPYPPGHAKLRTRWPLYVLGAYAFSYGSVALELALWNGSYRAVLAFVAVAVAIVAGLVVVRRRAVANWSPESDETSDESTSDLTLLSIRGA